MTTHERAMVYEALAGEAGRKADKLPEPMAGQMRQIEHLFRARAIQLLGDEVVENARREDPAFQERMRNATQRFLRSSRTFTSSGPQEGDLLQDAVAWVGRAAGAVTGGVAQGLLSSWGGLLLLGLLALFLSKGR